MGAMLFEIERLGRKRVKQVRLMKNKNRLQIIRDLQNHKVNKVNKANQVLYNKLLNSNPSKRMAKLTFSQK